MCKLVRKNTLLGNQMCNIYLYVYTHKYVKKKKNNLAYHYIMQLNNKLQLKLGTLWKLKYNFHPPAVAMEVKDV